MATRNKVSKRAAKRKSPWCARCERTIRVPKGWSSGAATRRHYWRAHRDVMIGRRGGRA